MANDLFNISGRAIVITGGTGVLGASLAEYFLGEGAQVAILGRDPAKMQRQLATLQKTHSGLLGFAGSVLDREFLESVNDSLLQQWGRIDALINTAGGNMPGAIVEEGDSVFAMDMGDFRKVSELNLDGSLLPTLVFGKSMAANGKGSIVNISSTAAIRALTRVVGYSASKAAIDNLTKWLATDLALKHGDGLRVNAIAPGFFIGSQNRDLLLGEDGRYTERGNTIVNKTPMKRFGRPEEFRGAAHWLISDASSFVTGAIIPVDGGFNAFSGV